MSTFEIAVLATYALTLVALSAFGLHRVFLSWLYKKHEDDVPVAPAMKHHPKVTIQLPVYNERAVIGRLIDATCAMDWPSQDLEIQVLDDSTDATTQLAQDRVRHWCGQGINIVHIHREVRTGFKAGALEAGAAQATGDFLAVFDADFVPTPDFLRRTLPHFSDPNVGMVQTRWGHINEEQNLLTRLSSTLLDGHFVLEHTARSRSGRFFNFNGTAGIWRRECVVAAGGWQHDTVTEDLDLSYRAQLAGWRFVFLQDAVVPAELPADMRAFKSQQHRWCKGTIQTATKLLGPILRSPLPAKVKREAAVHMLCNSCYPLVLLMAVLMPWTIAIREDGGLAELLLLDLPVFAMATLSVAIFYNHAHRVAYPDWRRRLWRIPAVMALGIGMSVNQTGALASGLFSRDVTFIRTPKAGDAGQAAYTLPGGWTPWVELTIAAYYAASIIWTAQHGHWASLPFMCLFFLGFAYVGIHSLAPAPEPRTS
jgi:cellulose synthase/poly-beta-1,6-N-acetylglucosamine synthase-like glycosyltransferase